MLLENDDVIYEKFKNNNKALAKIVEQKDEAFQTEYATVIENEDLDINCALKQTPNA